MSRALVIAEVERQFRDHRLISSHSFKIDDNNASKLLYIVERFIISSSGKILEREREKCSKNIKEYVKDYKKVRPNF